VADKVTTAALSAATGSGSAHALGNQRDTNDCEDSYEELPSVRQRPVVQRSQERLVLAGLARWLTRTISSTVSIAMTSDCGVSCTPNEAPRPR
jgi:hypothetical protein